MKHNPNLTTMSPIVHSYLIIPNDVIIRFRTKIWYRVYKILGERNSLFFANYEPEFIVC